MPTYIFPPPSSSSSNFHASQLADYPLRVVCDNPELNPNPQRCDPCVPLLTLPFVDGDILYFQLRSITPQLFATVSYFKPDGTLISSALEPVIPTGILHTIILTPVLIEKEFYIKIEVDATIHYTQLYCKDLCAHTVIMEGTYSGFDCKGFDYSVGYRNIIRLRGFFEKTSFTIEEETSANNRRISQTTSEVYTLKLHPILPNIADQIERVLGGKTVLINGAEYEFSGQVEKNIETNRAWLLDITLNKRICRTNLAC